MSEPLTLRTETGDEDLDLEEFEARVRRGEVSPQSLVRFPAVTGERFVAACELELFRALHEPRRAHFARAFRLARFPWITSTVIFLNLAIYLASVQSGPMDIDVMVRWGAKVGPLITDLGEVWRLFTANFLHRDALHIGLNMFVLFNVGGVLENAYRALDYLWLLVFAGVVTMTSSLFLSDAVSLGASGVVYGCLGGVVVFGLKYRAILPSRYRRVMSEAAIPTVIGLLLIGVIEPGVDSWAHMGGLLAGIGASVFMRPKLLADAPRAWWSPAVRAVPSLALLFAVGFGHVVFGDFLPVLRVRRYDAHGISVPLPRDWREGANPLGQVAYSNWLSGLGRATFAADVVEVGTPIDLAAQVKQFTEERLRPGLLGANVFKVEVEPPVPARIAHQDGLLVLGRFEEHGGTTNLRAYFVPRGDRLFQLVFTYSAAYPRYAAVIEQMVAGIRFDEPKAMREARALALLFPNASWALKRLGRALREEGDPFAAAEALRTAVQGLPADAGVRVQLALSLLQTGALDEACRASHAAVLYAPNDPFALEVDARCELEQGNHEKALARLQEARALAPNDERLRQAEAKLRAALAKPREEP